MTLVIRTGRYRCAICKSEYEIPDSHTCPEAPSPKVEKCDYCETRGVNCPNVLTPPQPLPVEDWEKELAPLVKESDNDSSVARQRMQDYLDQYWDIIKPKIRSLLARHQADLVAELVQKIEGVMDVDPSNYQRDETRIYNQPLSKVLSLLKPEDK